MHQRQLLIKLAGEALAATAHIELPKRERPCRVPQAPLLPNQEDPRLLHARVPWHWSKEQELLSTLVNVLLCHMSLSASRFWGVSLQESLSTIPRNRHRKYALDMMRKGGPA